MLVFLQNGRDLLSDASMTTSKRKGACCNLAPSWIDCQGSPGHQISRTSLQHSQLTGHVVQHLIPAAESLMINARGVYCMLIQFVTTIGAVMINSNTEESASCCSS